MMRGMAIGNLLSSVKNSNHIIMITFLGWIHHPSV
jgi:hypothetical protein